MIGSLLCSLISAFETRRSLALENLALRQQLAVLQHSVKRPQLSNVDRGMWALLRRVWTEWASMLVIVKLRDTEDRSTLVVFLEALFEV